MAKQRYPVSSSMISALEYDDDDKALTVVFRSGSEATYEDVPQDEVQALVSAPSVGKYFHQMIRDQYSTR